jgi:MvaI/BcnI restriction endonuclease family
MGEISSLAHLVALMKQHGATRIYAKKLAPNDNSKNQIYLGGDFSALNILPHQKIVTDANEIAGSKRDRAKAKVSFFWLDANGKHRAPETNLILYPKYPEIRMSGFLKGCSAAPSAVMASRAEGRLLFLGITPDQQVLAFSANSQSPIAAEVARRVFEPLGVFWQVPLDPDQDANSKALLLDELRRIYQMQWIASEKLTRDGVRQPYSGRNGGGYTLESALNISANSKPDADYLGWEVKQYGVANFERYQPKSPITLFTPEPVYRLGSSTKFVREYGYPDKSGTPDRINFGGIYTLGKAQHADTGLRMVLDGFDRDSDKITNIDGGLALVDRRGESVAEWKFTALMEHWNRKHAQAVYIPSIFRTPPPEYAFGAQILLCEQTDFVLFLSAIANGIVYYDPALKLENASNSASSAKARSQFRIKHTMITKVYHRNEVVDLSLG